jgi:hypothetical protein
VQHQLWELDSVHAEGLRKVGLQATDRREKRRYCRLANDVRDRELVAELAVRLDSPDAGIRRRAAWIFASQRQT